jgi:H+-transporting ATPase
MLMVLMLFANDFVTMSIATDRVRPAPTPQRWEVGRLMMAAGVFATLSLAFSLAIYFGARVLFALSAVQSQTLAFLILVFASQASVYALRTDTTPWSVPPSLWMATASIGDIAVVSLLAGFGLLMAAVPWTLIAVLLLASVALAVVLGAVKRPLFGRLAIA